MHNTHDNVSGLQLVHDSDFTIVTRYRGGRGVVGVVAVAVVVAVVVLPSTSTQ